MLRSLHRTRTEGHVDAVDGHDDQGVEWLCDSAAYDAGYRAGVVGITASTAW